MVCSFNISISLNTWSGARWGKVEITGEVVAISWNGAERNGTELRSKIRNRTGHTERSFLSCTAQKEVVDH